MKKIVLFFALAIVAFAAKAQYTLTGSSYTQNFDGIGSGLPTGWSCYKNATSTSLGTLDAFSTATNFGSYFDTTGCPSDVYGAGFKNSASGDVTSNCTALCATQQAGTNRCLAVRQTSGTGSHPGYDPGASFAFQMANTTGKSAFILTFNLQSLDETCPHITTWTLDYGIGAVPATFTTISTTGTMTTGGSACANNAITASLPSAINNQSVPVWIRISTLVASTGVGNRTTSGIDDLMLIWNPSDVKEISNISALSLNVLGAATTNKISFSYDAPIAGSYTLNIYDLMGHSVYTQSINATEGGQVITADGLNLAAGMYVAKMSNENLSAVAKIIVQ